MKVTEREILETPRSHSLGGGCKKRLRGRVRDEEERKGSECGKKEENEEKASQRKKRKTTKESRGWNNGRKLLGKINEGYQGNRAGRRVKIADLHKTQGYPRPLFSPRRTKRTFGDDVTLRRESRGATYNGSKIPARRVNNRDIK